MKNSRTRQRSRTPGVTLVVALLTLTSVAADGYGGEIAAGTAGAGPSTQQAAATARSAWTRAAPADAGLAPEPLQRLDREIREGRFGHVDRLVVARGDSLLLSERYDHDYRAISRGRSPLGCGVDACEDPSEVHQYNYLHPDFHPWYRGRDVHSLQSVTKSVTATLVGIALRRGEIASLDVPLLSFFAEYDLSRVDTRLHEATLEDLLTMRSGIEWHEQDRPFDETNTTLQLEAADDWIQFTLDQPMDAAPGTKWVYSSGGSHLMSGVIRSATGLFVDQYAELHLFGPLGIDDYHWKKTPSGYPDTEGGLYMEAEDLARIGRLYLNDGVWEGTRVLPEGWVAAATAKQVERVNGRGWGYGYQWWRVDRDDTVVWAGLGFGGQYLLVLPEHDLVGVVNSWNLFGASRADVSQALIDAMLEAAHGGAR